MKNTGAKGCKLRDYTKTKHFGDDGQVSADVLTAKEHFGIKLTRKERRAKAKMERKAPSAKDPQGEGEP